ncbi:MotA/TolQ/ExbB proton channel family protein [Pelagicoccus sp. SDUM812005]|uniref:MotA/TolQ/ExbB proton channel family protein n=1 Tax=Pelagicoccus sp. SDUM812005 TaxID=3041257 RepID=UPI00280F3671|nr:MotA/TolQ/ExbB proton channel family protein [Pelagicoccus sp. SDUM812005]MDQ8183479.1 MotA/TolQ/ExbB proton channel family protein [Pelagicoccus sp. SDUM812005]
MAIALLSVHIYGTAFRSLLLVGRVAAPYRSLDEWVSGGGWRMRVPDPWVRIVGYANRPDLDAEEVRSLFKRAVQRFTLKAQSDLFRLKIGVAAAPLLGLLGTIIGMIDTFEGISDTGGDTSVMVAGGISKALVTTNAGLVVALPALFLGFLIRRKLRQARLVANALEVAVVKEKELAAA